MIKRLLTVYLPAAAVLTIGTLAAVFLYQSPDPGLAQVAFIDADNTETVAEGDRIAEGADEEDAGRIAENAEENNGSESVDFVETYHGTSQPVDTNTVESMDRNDIRTEAIQPVIVVISGPGVSIRCELAAVDSQTAHQVMQQAADQCGFSYQTKQYSSLGVFVDGLGGVASDKSGGRYWIFYVNGTKANVGVSSYPLQPGDTITWKFEDEY